MKTQPISFRPSHDLDTRLDSMRDRTGIPKSQLVELLTDEAERTRRYAGIAFRGPDRRRRAWIVASPFDVWEVVQAWQDMGEDVEKARAHLGLTPRQVTVALAYYREFRDEIDRALTLARRSPDEIARGYPFIEVARVEA